MHHVVIKCSTVLVKEGMNEVHCWQASTSQAKVLSYFPPPEALNRLFLELSGLTGSEQDLFPILPLCNCDWP